MIVWASLVGTLGLNYARHRRGRSTLCSVTRQHVPVYEPAGRLAVVVAWGTLTGWLIPHLCSKRAQSFD